MMDLFNDKAISPMLIAENRTAFDDANYIFELKLDGIRALAYLSSEGTELRNKRNKRLNSIYPELKHIHKNIKRRCILDGELVVLHNGVPDFFELQRRSLMNNPVKIELAAKKLPVCFTAFDILYRDSDTLTGLPLMERKNILEQTITETPSLAVSRYIEKDGLALYQAAEQRGLEGIVAKRKDSKYYSGKRTKEWIKCKNLCDEDFVVCGYFFKEADKVSVILGSYDKGKLVYQSHVIMGVSRHDYGIINSEKKTDKIRYAGFPDFENVKWLEPNLVCAVQYMERTPGGGLRQPVFKGLRDDKEPGECILKEGLLIEADE